MVLKGITGDDDDDDDGITLMQNIKVAGSIGKIQTQGLSAFLT